MWHNLNLWVLAAYISLFVWQCFRQRQWLWLAGAVLLWWGGAALAARLLPGILGVEHLANAYIPHVYIATASLLCCLPGQRPPVGYLRDLACSGLLQHAALAVLALAVCWHYPGGFSLYAAPALLYHYLLQPTGWIAGQWMLMALWALHRRWLPETPVGGRSAWAAGFLLMLLLQTVQVVMDMAGRFMPG